jgi:pSer/pThr/pTyr-binding forkhead associated (FHA) protein
MWTLQTTDESATASRTFRITTGAVKTIGRASRADFIVDAAMVSRFHCRVTALPDGELQVQDLKSTNGTFVNGRRVTRALLTVGDRLQVGPVELTVERREKPTEPSGTG